MMRFLAGDSVMARMIREHDWSHHPFGQPETWPPSLRSALSICLHSAFPTAIYWGPDLRLLYNDAWMPIPGPRHPASLGAPAHEVWSDIWHIVGPQFDQLLATGDGIFVENQMLPMKRFGVPEETYWSYSFTAIRGETGEIVGIYNSGSETTANVRLQRETSFLLSLEQTLREVAEADHAWRIGADMLSQHLNLDWVDIVEVSGLSGGGLQETGWTILSGPSPTAQILPELMAERWGDLAAGPPLLIAELQGEASQLTEDARARLCAEGVSAIMTTALQQGADSALVAVLASRNARAWSEFDRSAARRALSRILASIERERVAERERTMTREIDHRARNALSAALSIVRLTRADTIDAVRQKIELRIAALARAHSILASEHWGHVDLHAVVRQELAPYTIGDTDAVTIEGPPLRLPPELAQGMTLVLHELATNAAKYGALRGPDGRLTLSWQVDPERTVRFRWTEHAADAASTQNAPASSKFGSKLLSRVVRAQLLGTIEQRLGPNGLIAKIEFPLSGTQARASAPDQDDDAGPGPQRRKKRILIAEDEALIAMDLETLVTQFGHDVFGTYSTVESALASIESDIPDVGVLDANLVGETSIPIGLALAERGVPVIFATGYDGLPDLPPILANAPLLSKPIGEDALAHAISTASLAGP